MTLKCKNNQSNVISVPELVENEVLHQSIRQLYQKIKIKDGDVHFGGLLGFGGHFECFTMNYRFLTGHDSIRHMENPLYACFHILSTKSTVGQHISFLCPGYMWQVKRLACSR